VVCLKNYPTGLSLRSIDVPPAPFDGSRGP
jgi:hypothetical protein